MDADDIEMNNLGETADQSGDDETNVENDTDVDDLTTGISDPYNDIVGDEFMDLLLFSPNDSVRADTTGASVWKLNMLRNLEVKEKILGKIYGVRFRGTYGEKTRSLLKSLRVRRSKNGNEVGLEFTNPNDVRSGNRKYKDVIIGYSTGNVREGLGATDAYRELVKEAKKEYNDNSLRASVERDLEPASGVNEGASTSETPQNIATDDLMGDVTDRLRALRDSPEASRSENLVTDDVMDEVTNRLLENLNDLIDTDREMVRNLARRMGKGDAEVREIDTATSANILSQNIGYKASLKMIDPNTKYWKGKLKGDDISPMEKELYGRALRTSELVKDYLRIKNELKPESEIAKELMKEIVGGSDQLRLGRFKKWMKKNAVGISGIAITIGALITGVVMGARNAMRVGARGLGKFASSVARVLKKLGPLFSALGTVISTALSLGAKGILWLANNLWILAIALSVIIYNKYFSQ